jgi:hypothetical protein
MQAERTLHNAGYAWSVPVVEKSLPYADGLGFFIG